MYTRNYQISYRFVARSLSCVDAVEAQTLKYCRSRSISPFLNVFLCKRTWPGYLDESLKLGHQFLFVLIGLAQGLFETTFKIVPIERSQSGGGAGGRRVLGKEVGCLRADYGVAVSMVVRSVVAIASSRL